MNQGTLVAAGGSAIGDRSNVSLENRPGVIFQITANEAIGGILGGGAD